MLNSAFINAINQALGKISAWLLLVMMLLTVVLVAMRYLFESGSIALQEVITLCHGCTFLLGLGYTLSLDQHVRVDIFYQRFTRRQRDWVNAIGCLLFLFPFCGFMSLRGFDFFYASFMIQESSPEPGGLPYLFLFKALLPLSFFMLLLQGCVLFFSSASRLVISKAHLSQP